jgi:hypothetical protein
VLLLLLLVVVVVLLCSQVACPMMQGSSGTSSNPQFAAGLGNKQSYMCFMACGLTKGVCKDPAVVAVGMSGWWICVAQPLAQGLRSEWTVGCEV